VAVGRCRRDFAGAEIAGNAGAVLDHDRMAPTRREPLGEKPRHNVRPAGGKRRHDDPHGAGRIIRGVLRKGGDGGGAEEAEDERKMTEKKAAAGFTSPQH
jgi:hypothetical protein